jgi:hypothetical protein
MKPLAGTNWCQPSHNENHPAHCHGKLPPDDEGNDAGALFIQAGAKTATLPEVAPRL